MWLANYHKQVEKMLIECYECVNKVSTKTADDSNFITIEIKFAHVGC